MILRKKKCSGQDECDMDVPQSRLISLLKIKNETVKIPWFQFHFADASVSFVTSHMQMTGLENKVTGLFHSPHSPSTSQALKIVSDSPHMHSYLHRITFDELHSFCVHTALGVMMVSHQQMEVNCPCFVHLNQSLNVIEFSKVHCVQPTG